MLYLTITYKDSSGWTQCDYFSASTASYTHSELLHRALCEINPPDNFTAKFSTRRPAKAYPESLTEFYV